MIPNPRKFIAKARVGVRLMRRSCPNMFEYILYGLLFDLGQNLYKPFGTKFIERLGGGEGYITLYNALPGVFAIFAIIPGSIFISRFKNKKRVTAAFYLVSRSCLMLAAAVPFLYAGARPLMFVAVIAAMNFPEAIATCGFQSFLSTALDDGYRAKAISRRTGSGQVIIPVATLLTGLIIAFIPKTDAQRMIAYQLFFVAAFLVGIFEIVTFLRFKPARPERSAEGDKPRISEALRDKRFLRFLFCTLAFYLPWQAGWPLGGMVVVLDLRANEMWLAIQAVTSGVVAFIASGWWNRRISRHGNSRVLVESAFGLGISSLMYAFAPNNAVMAFVTAFGGGVSVAMGITMLNGLLEATPDRHRIVYIGVYNTCVSLSLAVSSFIAHGLYLQFGARGAMMVVSCGRFAAAGFMAVVLLKVFRGETVN